MIGVRIPTNAPAILLLPGNMCDARLWNDVIPHLGGRAVACPSLDSDDRIDAMANRVLDCHEGMLIPVGFSMGAIVALAIARLAPQRVAAIGLLDANASADLAERAAVRPAQQRAVREGALDTIVTDQLMPHYLATANAGDERLKSLIRNMALALGADVFVRQSEALRTRSDQRDVLPALDIPSFLACGAEDRLCPPEWHRAMAEEARDTELHVIEGAGHMLPLEQPAALGTVLNAWFDRILKDAHATIS